MRKTFALVISVLLIVAAFVGCDPHNVQKLNDENAYLRQSNNELDSLNSNLLTQQDSLRRLLEAANKQNIDSAMQAVVAEIPLLEKSAAEAQEGGREETYIGGDANGGLSSMADDLHNAWTLWLRRGRPEELGTLLKARNLLLVVYKMDLKTPDPEWVLQREGRTGEEPSKQKMVDWLSRFNQNAVPPLYGPDGLHESGG